MTNDLACPCAAESCTGIAAENFMKADSLPGPEALMRSRYSAYALGLVDYILKTTHPDTAKPSKEELEDFSRDTTFQKLDVRDVKESGDLAFVTFIAYLMQDGRDATFTEESRFEKIGDEWFYHSGTVFPGAKLL